MGSEIVVERQRSDGLTELRVTANSGQVIAIEFTPVKARVFRLTIPDASDVPTIWEFQLFCEANQ